MRKFAFLLIVALLITVPAFAIGNQLVAMSPALVTAAPIENAEIIDRVPVIQVAYAEEVDDQATEARYVKDTSAPATQPAVAVVVVSAKAQETIVTTAPVVVTAVPTAQATPVLPVVAPAPVVSVAPAPVVSVTPAPVVVAADTPLIDVSKAQQGIVTINYSGTVKARLEVRKGDVKYYYNLYAGQDNFPLQLGSGQYTITVFENTTDNRYRAVDRSIIDVSITSTNSVFLASIQEIEWSEDSLAVAKARELTAGLGTDRAKFEAVYRYVVDNIDYDTPKLATLTSTYLPNIDTTLSTGKGICYDHASLIAAMLRSEGIPTKMVKGYASTVQGYHAWNEVYVDGQWLIIDASVDAQRRARGAELTMVKTSAVYSKTLEF